MGCVASVRQALIGYAASPAAHTTGVNGRYPTDGVEYVQLYVMYSQC